MWWEVILTSLPSNFLGCYFLQPSTIRWSKITLIVSCWNIHTIIHHLNRVNGRSSNRNPLLQSSTWSSSSCNKTRWIPLQKTRKNKVIKMFKNISNEIMKYKFNKTKGIVGKALAYTLLFIVVMMLGVVVLTAMSNFVL